MVMVELGVYIILIYYVMYLFYLFNFFVFLQSMVDVISRTI